MPFFAEGMKPGINARLEAWSMPGRALLPDLPLVMRLMALLAKFVIGLGWLESLLVGVVLSPMDTVFASALSSTLKYQGIYRGYTKSSILCE